MAFPFPKLKREIFPKTFLKSFSVCFDYEPVKRDIVAETKQFFKEKFNFTDIDKSAIIQGVEVRSQDDLIRFSFKLDTVEVRLKFPVYKHFEKAKLWFRYLIDFLEVMQIEEIKSLTITKKNLLSFQLNEHQKIKEAMKQVFSDELLQEGFVGNSSYDRESDTFDTLPKWQKSIVFNDDYFASQFTIDYGFIKKVGRENEGEFVLTNTLSSCAHCVTQEILSRMSLLNEVMDNEFCWCIKETIIDKMRETE